VPPFFIGQHTYSMALINFKDWLIQYREASPMTRARDAWMRGTGVLRADFMSRSTPHPAAVEKLQDELEKPKKRKKKKKKKSS
jgi:hypothetical protein